MSRLSRQAIQELVHQALAARVRLLLGQIGFDELMAVQVRVAQALAEGAWPWHGPSRDAGSQALAEAALEAFGLDPVYYGGSSLDFILSEALAGAGMHLADAVRGHEQAGRATWQSVVVPRLDQVLASVTGVLDGSARRRASA